MKLLILFGKIFRYYKKIISDNKNWFLFAAGILVCGAITGALVSFFIPTFGETTLSNYAQSIDPNIEIGWNLSWYVFKRNLLIVTISNLFGIVFGIIPFLVTYFNGLVLGIVLGYLPLKGSVNPIQLFVLIAPHGIFEYSATLLGMSFGLRLGINWMFDKKGKSRREVFVEDLKKLISIYPLVFLLLGVAAMIEGLVTIKVSCILGGLCD